MLKSSSVGQLITLLLAPFNKTQSLAKPIFGAGCYLCSVLEPKQ